jgi:hypothetical protein
MRNLCNDEGGVGIGAGHACLCIRWAGHQVATDAEETHACSCGARWWPKPAPLSLAPEGAKPADPLAPPARAALTALTAELRVLTAQAETAAVQVRPDRLEVRGEDAYRVWIDQVDSLSVRTLDRPDGGAPGVFVTAGDRLEYGGDMRCLRPREARALAHALLAAANDSERTP